MGKIIISIEGHTCQPPELLNVSSGFSGGTNDVMFKISYESIWDWYREYVDPNAELRIEYNYQDGTGWLGSQVDVESNTDYEFHIEKRIGYTTVQFRITLITDSECGTMYSNVLSSVYT